MRVRGRDLIYQADFVGFIYWERETQAIFVVSSHIFGLSPLLPSLRRLAQSCGLTTRYPKIWRNRLANDVVEVTSWLALLMRTLPPNSEGNVRKRGLHQRHVTPVHSRITIIYIRNCLSSPYSHDRSSACIGITWARVIGLEDEIARSRLTKLYARIERGCGRNIKILRNARVVQWDLRCNNSSDFLLNWPSSPWVHRRVY